MNVKSNSNSCGSSMISESMIVIAIGEASRIFR